MTWGHVCTEHHCNTHFQVLQMYFTAHAVFACGLGCVGVGGVGVEKKVEEPRTYLKSSTSSQYGRHFNSTVYFLLFFFSLLCRCSWNRWQEVQDEQ